MAELLDRFKKDITLGNAITIVMLIFLAGGAWYLLPERIEANRGALEAHVENQFVPLRNKVENNTDRLINVEGNYGNLRDLIEEQQQNETERYERIENRLDYIINRLDRQ